MNHPIMFVDCENKTKLVPTYYSYFLERKISFNLKSGIVITVTIVLHYKETNATILFILLLQKSSWKIKLREFKSNQKSFTK